jgi:hypothetical protein
MVVPHYAYLTLKIPGPKGTITVQGSFEVANTYDREFNRMAQTFGMIAEYKRLKGETDHNVLPDVGRSLLDQAFDTTQDSKKIQVHPMDPNKTTSIVVNLDPALECALVRFLHEGWEIFAWCPSDMPGVPRELVEHALNVDPKAKPVKQPLWQFDEPKRKAIASELHRLENAGFIREIKTLSWVSNPVIIPKKNTNVQRVYVDYTSLNKHCPKDPFPLPRIDQIIDSIAGCARLSFLDAYSGYNHIKLKKEDKEKMAFITS